MFYCRVTHIEQSNVLSFNKSFLDIPARERSLLGGMTEFSVNDCETDFKRRIKKVQELGSFLLKSLEIDSAIVFYSKSSNPFDIEQ